MAQLPDRIRHLVVTSPPYFDLKKYPDNDAQLGGLHDYEVFRAQLRRALEIRRDRSRAPWWIRASSDGP